VVVHHPSRRSLEKFRIHGGDNAVTSWHWRPPDCASFGKIRRAHARVCEQTR
jgi:hypothetical protein